MHNGSGTNADPLIVVARTMVVVKDDAEEPDTGRRLVNSIFLGVFLALLTCWFILHLRTYVTQRVVLGSLTVWSVLQLFASSLNRSAGKDGEKITQKVLGHKATTWVFQGAIAVVLVLFIMTSSLYVKLGEMKTSDVDIEVRDAETGKPLLDSIKLDFSSKAGGRPYFLPRWGGRNLVLVVKQPPGYQNRPLVLRAGEPAELSFPEQFRKRTLVRIFAPYRLKDHIRIESDAQFRQATLEIATQNRSVGVPFPFKCVYVGVSDTHLGDELVSQSLASFEDARRMELRGKVEAGELESLLSEWRLNPALLPQWDLREGDVVSAVYKVAGQRILACSAKVSESRVNDCVLTEVR